MFWGSMKLMQGKLQFDASSKRAEEEFVRFIVFLGLAKSIIDKFSFFHWLH